MGEEKYLNEEKYQKTKKKIAIIAVIILLIGFTIGGSLIAIGLKKTGDIEKRYSDESKRNEIARMENEKLEIQKKIASEKEKIKKEKQVLDDKVRAVEEEISKLQRVDFNGFDDAYYERQDKIKDLKDSIKEDEENISVFDDVLEDTYTSAVEKNPLTAECYKLNKELDKKESEIEDIDRIYENEKSSQSFDCRTFYIFGGMVCFMTLMMSSSIYISTKRREIMAYRAQQVAPIAKEGMEEIAPSIGKVVGEVVKNIKDESKDDKNT